MAIEGHSRSSIGLIALDLATGKLADKQKIKKTVKQDANS